MKKSYTYLIAFALLCIVLCCYADIVRNVKSIHGPAKNSHHKVFDCPVISIDNMSRVDASCSNSDGSITGLTVTPSNNKTKYTWRDASGKTVGTSLDLVKVPAGTYILEVIDNAICPDGVTSPAITIDGINKVSITGSPDVKGSTGCNSDGYIKNLTVTGATRYDWLCLETGITYTSITTPDLVNASQGDYKLTASNASCQASSGIFNIPPPVRPPQVATLTVKQTTCNQANGDISYSLIREPNAPAITWIFFKGTDIIKNGVFGPGGMSPMLEFAGLSEGNYHLAVYADDIRCPTQVGSTITLRAPVLIVYPDSSTIVNDNCNQHLGSIVPYMTGLTPPMKGILPRYTWTNVATGEVIGHDKGLLKIGAGTYQFDIVDYYGCPASAQFVVRNSSPPIAQPTAGGSTICLPGRVIINASCADTGGVFKLYASLNDTIPLAVSEHGGFNRIIDQTTDFYISHTNADCESERTKVTETVLASIKIPNSFTPNNDGVNDTWVISGLDKFPGAEVKLFDRSGQQIFYSVNNSPVFDGSYKGKTLPVGVYYYVIDVKEQRCFGQISGTLTLLR